MARPQITVNITGAVPVAGAPVDTGTLFFVYAGTGGPSVPTTCRSIADAVAAGVPAPTAAWVGDALAQGAPEVIVLRAAAVDPATVTLAEWNTALAVLTPSYGPGQVVIPGVSTAFAHQALLAHVAASPQRVALLDAGSADSAATIAAAAAALAASAGATRSAFVTPWAKFPDIGGTSRTTPASIVAAGLAARGDAVVGNANNSPIFDQGRGAGTVIGASGVTAAFTDADTDTLYTAGVNAIRYWNSVYALTGWEALASTDPIWHQFGIGRLAMQLTAGLTSIMGQFLGQQIDGKGHLFSAIDGAIRGYLLDIYEEAGLYGETPADAFDVVCDFTNNTPATIAAGQVHASVSIVATSSTEQITIDVVTSLA